jgi:hypothetical protein
MASQQLEDDGEARGSTEMKTWTVGHKWEWDLSVRAGEGRGSHNTSCGGGGGGRAFSAKGSQPCGEPQQ